MALPSFDDLNSALRSRFDALVLRLLGEPSGKRRGNTWRYGRKGSLSVTVSGPHCGNWCDFERSESGGPLDLIMREHRCDLEDAAAWAASWLGLGPSVTVARGPRVTFEAIDDDGTASISEAEADRTRKTAYAARLFNACDRLDSTHAAAYLSARGLTIPPGAPLLFHASLKHGPSGRYFPAMVARVDRPDGTLSAIHRTFLDLVEPKKADVEPNKMMLGPVDGCAVRLTPGPVGLTLIVAEGIETALALWLATGLPVWAALSANGIRALVLPPLPEAREVTIAADNDETGMQAALDAAAQWTADGRTVRIIVAPNLGDGGKGHDFNDLLQARGLGAVQLLVNRAVLWAPVAPPDCEIVLPAPPLPKGVLTGVAPRSMAKPMEAAAVESKLELIVRDFLVQSIASTKVRREIDGAKAETTDRFLAENPELDPKLNYGINPADRKSILTRQYIRAIGGVRREARRKVLEGYGLDSIPVTPRYQIAAGAGSGKTRAVIQVIASNPDARRAVFHYYVPNHELAADVAERFKAAGIRTWILRGRTAKGDDGAPVCHKPHLAARVGELGLNVTKAICKDGTSECEFFPQCSYWRQTRDMTGPGAIIMPHAYLKLPKPDGVPAADAVIVDESARTTLVAHKSLDPAELGESGHWDAGPAETADFLDVCRRVRDALLEDGATRTALQARGIERDDLLRAIQFARNAMDDFAAISPSMSETRALKALESFKPSPRATILKLLSRLASEMAKDRDQMHGVAVRTVAATITDTGEKASHRRIYVHYRSRLLIKGTTPILHLDAGADAEHGVILWGPHTQHFSLPVRRNAIVVQVADLSFSKSSLLVTDSTSPKERKTVTGRLDRVRRFIAAQTTIFGPNKALSVTYKRVRCALTGEDAAGALPAGCDLNGATVAHFGNIRGIDLWKGYNCGIIVGREQIPPLEVEAITRALHCDDDEPLNLKGEYVKQQVGYQMKDGSELGVMDWMHPDPKACRVLELTREHESEQAMDRLRMVHRMEPAKVYVLGKLPLPVPVDRIVAFDDLLLGAEIEAALVRRGALPLSAEWLAEFEPALFVEKRGGKPAISAIKAAIARTGLSGGSQSRTPIKIPYWSSGLCSMALYRTRRGGPEKRALINIFYTYPRAALAAVLGEPVTEFRLLKIRVEDRPAPQAAGRVTEEITMPAIATPPVRMPPAAPLLRPVEIGEVMPFHKHPRGEMSEIRVRPWTTFPELLKWDEAGRPAGWSFGLPLPASYWPAPDEAA